MILPLWWNPAFQPVMGEPEPPPDPVDVERRYKASRRRGRRSV